MTPVVIITGASKGIGAATAAWLGDYGATVVLVARHAKALAKIGDQMRARGATVLTIPVDITSEGLVARVTSACLDHFGRVDALVNNAAIIGEVARISSAGPLTWRSVYEVNVFAALACVQATLPALRETHGRVVNVTSAVAVATKPAEALGAYASSKAALNHFTRILACEEPGVTVVGYQPGPTDTELMSAILERSPQVMSTPAADYYRRLAAGGFVDLASTSRTLAALALRAPHDWTGRIVDHSDADARALAAEAYGSVG